jgi:hypothetical protein
MSLAQIVFDGVTKWSSDTEGGNQGSGPCNDLLYILSINQTPRLKKNERTLGCRLSCNLCGYGCCRCHVEYSTSLHVGLEWQGQWLLRVHWKQPVQFRWPPPAIKLLHLLCFVCLFCFWRCREMSTQSAGLYYGNYITQEAVRQADCGQQVCGQVHLRRKQDPCLW